MTEKISEYLNKGLLIILFAIFAATLAASTYFTYNMLSLNKLIQKSSEDVSATMKLQDLLYNLRQAESGQRGYLLTGNENYLTPYNQSVAAIPKDVAGIQASPSLDGYRDQTSQLADLTQRRIADLNAAISAYQASGFEAGQAIVLQTQASKLTAQIRTLADTIGQNAFKEIGPQQQRSQQNAKRSLVITVILDTFILAMCGIIVWYFHRTIVRERAIEGAKSEFLSLASHQLRTPATAVKQYLGMLQDGFFGKLTADQQDAVKTAYTSNESGIGIINSLLNAAKLSLGRIQLNRKPVVVASLVQEVADEYREQLAAKDQKLFFSNAIGKRKVRLDATYFKSIVENIVDNACKYSPDGAQIKLRLSLTSDKRSFSLSVADNGIGIGRQDLSRLFLKFSRLQNEFSETSEGSGLGLYWAKQVVELHGGTVSVRSRIGKGTTFRITLPLKQ